MATPILGKEFVIVYDGSAIGLATDFTLSVDKKTVDVTTLASAGWTDYMAMDKNWTVDFNGLVSRTSGDVSRGYGYLMNSMLTVDTSVVGYVKPNFVGNDYWYGNGFLTSLKLTGGVGNKVTFSGSFQGTGSLTKGTT
jgi:hypothetical protein